MDKEIEELIEKIREKSNRYCVSVNIFINCEENKITINNRTPKQLKQQKISMRNIQGEFIQ